MAIPVQTLGFLSDLKLNNSREWFQENRKRYDAVKLNFEEIIQELILSIGEFEDLTGVQVKNCNYRINRDVRFSNDKSPYKSWLSASFSQGGRKSGRMDYYLHIQPDGESFLGGGFYNSTTEQLAMLRQEIDYNPTALKEIIYSEKFTEVFPKIWGNSLKTMPKGYPKDHPEIELLKRQQLFFMHPYTDAEVCSPTFVHDVTAHCKVLKPYLDFLNFVFFHQD